MSKGEFFHRKILSEHACLLLRQVKIASIISFQLDTAQKIEMLRFQIKL